ncbi:MAG: SDR family NAD(P)-dependent oxidoreductase, partial [Myxococcota bacterium]
MDHPILVTGATGGLGRRLALDLAMRGASVLVGGRRPDAVNALCEQIDRRTPGRAAPFVADLADLDAVRSALDALSGPSLRGIVTNAGISTVREDRSTQGYEITFAVNVLAHQLILCRLTPRVVDGGRVVVLSSGVHDPDNRLARSAGIPVPRWVGTRGQALPESLPEDERLDSGPLRYSTSKLTNVLQARGLQSRLRDAGRDIDVFAVDPGLMIDTGLAREVPAVLRMILRPIGYLATPFVGNMRFSWVTSRMLTGL